MNMTHYSVEYVKFLTEFGVNSMATTSFSCLQQTILTLNCGGPSVEKAEEWHRINSHRRPTTSGVKGSPQTFSPRRKVTLLS